MNLRKTIFLTLSLYVATSCNISSIGDKSGKVSFSVENDIYVTEITKGAVSSYTALPAPGDFTLKVTDGDGVSIYEGLLSDWDSSTKIPSGAYEAAVSYGTEGEEGFDKPFFTGSSSFTVTGGETTNVSVPAALTNSIVKVTRSEAFTNYFVSSDFVVTTGNGNEIAFPLSESRGAFVDAYKITVSGSVTSQGGSTKSFSKEYSGLEPATCYELAFDVEGVGGATITISFNDTVESVELEDIELND